MRSAWSPRKTRRRPDLLPARSADVENCRWLVGVIASGLDCCKAKVHFEQVTIIATLLGHGEPDRFRLHCRFKVLDEAVRALKSSVMNSVEHDYLGRTNWRICKLDNVHADIPATVVPIRDPDAAKKRFIAIYFKSPLPAGSGPYQLDISDYTDVIFDETYGQRHTAIHQRDGRWRDRADGICDQPLPQPRFSRSG
jgi:hypothetical protein